MQTRRQALAAAGLGAVVSLARPALAQPRSVEIWTFEPPGDGNLVAKAVGHVAERWAATNPSIELKWNSMPWQQLSPTLLRASRARRVPDVVMLFSPDMPVHIAARTIVPLADRVSAWPADKQADIVRLRQSQDAEGRAYALPWQVRTSGLVYRADLLERARVAPPSTLPEWSDAAAAAMGGETVGFAMGFNPAGASISAAWFIVTQLGLGAAVLKPDGTADFQTEQARRIVTWMAAQVKGRTPPTLPLDVALQEQEKQHDLFSARRAVFLPTSSDRHARMVSQSGLPFEAIGMTAYPTFTAGKPVPALVQGWNLAIPEAARSPDLAWQLIDFWTSGPIQGAMASIAGMGPVRRTALEHPFFREPQSKVIRWATEYAAENPMQFEFPTNASVLYDTVVRMFAQVLNGNMGVDQALAWAEVDFNQKRRG